MPTIKVPKTCTAITINAAPLVPVNQEIVVSVLEARVMLPLQHQPYLVTTLANGNVTLRCPPPVDSMTLGGVPYGKDGNGDFAGIPALVATAFLKDENDRTFNYVKE